VKKLRKLKIEELKLGMILAEPILLGEGEVELLSKGSELTQRHITLLKRIGVDAVVVAKNLEELEGTDVELTDEEHVEVIKRKAEEAGEAFDAASYKEALEEVNGFKYEPVLTSVVNKTMPIHVLTGEGNIPIDERHKELIIHTEKAFNHLKKADEIDMDMIRDDIEKALPDMVRNDDVLMRLSQLKQSDDYTFEHSLRVSILATMIGKWLGYGWEQLSELAQAALLFDVGKLKIPDFILTKPDKTTPEEYEVIKKHAQFGYSVLLKTKGMTNNIKYSALQHHERIDGSGYPLRLKAGQIHEFAKIIMVCDIFDAMTTDRPYKKKVSPFVAAEYISWNSGVTLDSRICYVFLSNLAGFFKGKEVLLSTGQRGKIVFVDVNFPTRPVVQVGTEFIDLVKSKEVTVDELYN